MKLSERSGIAVVEIQKPTHSLFRFLQSVGKDIQYSIRDYGSEQEFRIPRNYILPRYYKLNGIEFRLIEERDIIGLFQKKMTISININLRDSTCFIECFTWNDFGSELQSISDATDTTK